MRTPLTPLYLEWRGVRAQVQSLHYEAVASMSALVGGPNFDAHIPLREAAPEAKRGPDAGADGGWDQKDGCDREGATASAWDARDGGGDAVEGGAKSAVLSWLNEVLVRSVQSVCDQQAQQA